MPFVPVPNTALVEIQMSFLSQDVENTFHISKLAPFEISDLEEMAQAIVVWWQEECVPLYSNDVILRAVKLTSLESDTAPVWEEPVNALNVGSGGVASMPGNVTFTITFLTSERGRSRRGRNYITGLTEGACSGNQVNQSHVTAWLAAYEDLKSRIDTLNRFMVVASKFSGVDSQGKPIPREEGIATIVTGFRVFDLNLDSQRRRLAGRGQ